MKFSDVDIPTPAEVDVPSNHCDVPTDILEQVAKSIKKQGPNRRVLIPLSVIGDTNYQNQLENILTLAGWLTNWNLSTKTLILIPRN